MSRTLIGYNVYRAADGCDEEYYGFAKTLADAVKLAQTAGRLPASLYDTARAAGHCGGKHAPDKSNEGAVAEWFGSDGYDCAVEVFSGSDGSIAVSDALDACEDVQYVRVECAGREFVVTLNTGERSYGDGGGVLAFAYDAEDTANVSAESISNYSDFCEVFSPTRSKMLAYFLAVERGYRLTEGGTCNPILGDTDFAFATAVGNCAAKRLISWEYVDFDFE